MDLPIKDDRGKKGGLNPLASGFNPHASSFVPGGARPPPPPGPAPPAPVLSQEEMAKFLSLAKGGPASEPVAKPAPKQTPPPPPAPRAEPPKENAALAEAAKQKLNVGKEAVEDWERSGDDAEAHGEAGAGDRDAEPGLAKDESSSKPAAPAAPEEPPEPEEADSERVARVQKILDELNAQDSRDHMNVVFIGHVDAGKSTLGGRILYMTGGVDERTIEKYEKEAKEKSRDSWYMAYIMDTNEEERAKGKTVEVGRANFGTEKRRYTILDAPGHKNYVPNMIAGATQADVGVLVISARKGEFEAGFERGGQTREHAQLAKTLGVQKLVCVVNKMDEPSIVLPGGKWSQERFDEIEKKMGPFLKGCGYQGKDIIFVPISGLHGVNLQTPVDKSVCDWWTGSTLFRILDEMVLPERDPLAGFRMPVMDKIKDLGCCVSGKSEQGIVCVGDRLLVMPNRVTVKVTALWRDDEEVQAAKPGENLKLRIQGIDDEDVQPGFVVCSKANPVPAATHFECQLMVLDLLDHKSIFTAGYKCVLHIHTATEECEVTKILCKVDPKTKERDTKCRFVKSGAMVICRIRMEKVTCVETFDKVPQLGRFTLRDEGKTIAIGKITRLPKA